MIKKILRKDIKLSLLNIRWCRIMQGVVLLSGLAVNAQNPIIQTSYTADPAPMVYNDKLYLYTSHDEDGSTWFTMNDWKLYSTDDMVNWTEHPTLLSFNTFEWAGGDAWAEQCIERDGKFYMYVPVTDRKGETAIGVAVADSPYGPFYDPIGAPLVRADYGNIDPTVFIDEDGQAYLYWGNPNCYYVKLNKDMISYKGEIHAVPMKPEAFGRREGDPQRPTLYEEAPWLYKRKGMYYLFYAGGPVPEHLAYATAESPEGPWKYGGTLMATEGGSFTNHPGIADFKGKTYFVCHNGSLPGGNGYSRSACVTELNFNDDGSIDLFEETAAGPAGPTSAITLDSGKALSHEGFVNSSADSDYPYTKIKIGLDIGDSENDNKWVITAGKADSSQDPYVSIQSENKAGLYITANKDGSVTLAQDTDGSDKTAKKQTFKTLEGFDDKDGITFESVSQEGMYLCIKDDILALTDSKSDATTFYIK